MLKVKYLKKIIMAFFGLPIYWLSMLSTRDKNIMVFGEWHGKKYCDNPKYLFEYLNFNVEGVKFFWITKDKKIAKEIKEIGLPCEYAHSLIGIYLCLKAKYAFVTHDSADINENLLGGCVLINLTHGTPLKKIGADAQYARLGSLTYFYDKYIKSIIPSSKKFEFIFCADEMSKDRFKTAFNYPVTILPFGYPRWDGLFESDSKLNDVVKSYKKVISYLPTLRFCNHVQLDPFSFYGFNEFISFVERHNYLLIIRPHPSMKYFSKSINSKNILLVTSDDVADVNEVLQVTDVLISDYSSVIYDFEKTGKPIILLAPDAQVFINADVGIYGDYYKDFTWPLVMRWNDAYKCIQEFENTSEVMIKVSYQESAKKIFSYISKL